MAHAQAQKWLSTKATVTPGGGSRAPPTDPSALLGGLDRQGGGGDPQRGAFPELAQLSRFEVKLPLTACRFAAKHKSEPMGVQLPMSASKVQLTMWLNDDVMEDARVEEGAYNPAGRTGLLLSEGGTYPATSTAGSPADATLMRRLLCSHRQAAPSSLSCSLPRP